MSGVNIALRLGPKGYEVSAAVTGGQGVEVDGTTGKIKPWSADSITFLGVALMDALPAGSDSNTNFTTARPQVAVAYGPAVVEMTYAASATFGQRLVAAAAGKVTPATVTDGKVVGSVVGICDVPAGVQANALGHVRLV